MTGNQWANRPEKLLDGAVYTAYKKELETLRDKVKAHKLSKQEYDRAARRYGKQIIRYTKLEYINWDGEWLEVPEDVQLSYRRDRKNKSGVNLFDEKGHPKFFLTRAKIEQLTGKVLPKRVAILIPCHCISEGKQIKAFGHGQCFRVPYEQRINQAVKVAGNDLRDFADWSSGRKRLLAVSTYRTRRPKALLNLRRLKLICSCRPTRLFINFISNNRPASLNIGIPSARRFAAIKYVGTTSRLIDRRAGRSWTTIINARLITA